MNKIFLCSYFAEVASILSESVSVPLRGKTVAFIPTASIHEAYTQYVEEARVAFDSLGIIVRELEITQCSKNEIEEVLTSCDCIYVSGGNTFFSLAGIEENRCQQIYHRAGGERKTVHWGISRSDDSCSQHRICQGYG